MVELSIRLLVAAVAMLVAGWLGRPEFGVAWKVAAVTAAYAALAYRLEVRGLKNPGIAGFVAVADAFALAFLLASAGVLGELGFLVLAPCAYAAARYGSLPTGMAPLAAAALLCAETGAGAGEVPQTVLLAQAGAVMVVGLLLNHRRIVMTVTRERDAVLEEPSRGPEPEGFLELRDNFRKLRDAYRDLERKSRRDRLVAHLQESRFGGGGPFAERLTAKVVELTGAQSAALYTVAQFGDRLVVRSVTGEVPDEMHTESFAIDASRGPGQVRQALQDSFASVLGEASRESLAHVMLTEAGRVTGMLVLGHPRPGHLAEVRERAEEMAPFVAALLRENEERSATVRRLRETEILYEAAAVAAGADTPVALCARVVRQVAETLGADHVGVCLLEEGEEVPVAQAGTSVRLLEAMQFDAGEGVEGWLASGAPELAMHDVADDPRCPPREALKRRVHSFCLVPLQFAEEPCGYLTAASHRSGGVDVRDLEALRTIATELSQGLGRLMEPSEGPSGFTTPAEFHELVASGKGGTFVVLEPIRYAALVERFGHPAVEAALKTFERKLRGRLPAGGALCRRDEGDFLVFLRGGTRAFATGWANEAAAHASLVPLQTPDGTETVPLAVRARVASMAPQRGGVYGETAA